MDLKNLVLTAAIGGILVLGGMVWSGGYDQKAKGDVRQEYKHLVEMVVAAQVTADQAITIALDNFPGKVVEAELRQKHRRTMWDVGILTGERGLMGVQIDAVSGFVIDTQEKMDGQ